jgi:hypothetical protein
MMCDCVCVCTEDCEALVAEHPIVFCLLKNDSILFLSASLLEERARKLDEFPNVQEVSLNIEIRNSAVKK